MRTPFKVAGIIAGTILALSSLVVLTKTSAPSTPAISSATQPTPSAPENGESKTVEAQSPTMQERAAQWENLHRALAETTPLMADTFNEHSLGTLTLTIWSMNRLKLPDILALPETSRGRVLKDSLPTRGLRLCVAGVVNQIEAERTDFGTFYSGGMMRGYDVTRFIAVGDTDTIEEGRRARFCGIVTGRYSYHNTGGGVTIAPMLVGMFDLPPNP